MGDVFLSYDREDLERARPFAQALSDIGWEVFWDREVPIGTNWSDILDEELKKVKGVIVLWSKHSVNSRWVRIEAMDADKKGKYIPAVIDEDIELPLDFRYYKQNALLSDWDGNPRAYEFQRLTRAIARLAGGYPEGSRKKLTTAQNRRDLIKALDDQGFQRSPRSNHLYYDAHRPDLRIRILENRVRIENRSDSRWKVRESMQLEMPINNVLKAIASPQVIQ